MLKPIKPEESVCIGCKKYHPKSTTNNCKIYLKIRKDKCIIIACPYMVKRNANDTDD